MLLLLLLYKKANKVKNKLAGTYVEIRGIQMVKISNKYKN